MRYTFRKSSDGRSLFDVDLGWSLSEQLFDSDAMVEPELREANAGRSQFQFSRDGK